MDSYIFICFKGKIVQLQMAIVLWSYESLRIHQSLDSMFVFIFVSS